MSDIYTTYQRIGIITGLFDRTSELHDELSKLSFGYNSGHTELRFHTPPSGKGRVSVRDSRDVSNATRPIHEIRSFLSFLYAFGKQYVPIHESSAKAGSGY